jgi:hypothetical protein
LDDKGCIILTKANSQDCANFHIRSHATQGVLVMIVKDKAYVNLSSQLAISIISIGQAVTLNYYVLKKQ